MNMTLGSSLDVIRPSRSGHVVPYPRLEKLILNNNKLLDMKTFAVLAGLQKFDKESYSEET